MAITFTNLTRATEIGANCYCLDAAGHRIVLDSGMHPKHDGDAALPQFGRMEDGSADAIVLSHAHQDHVGSLPVLMRRQPRAQVFMTEATMHLADVMLHNSVNVMSKRSEEGTGGVAPHFTHREVEMQSRRWFPVPLHLRFDIHGERVSPKEEVDVSFELFDAGHILGAAGTLIRAEGRTIFYTGDVNFEDQTLMRAARFPEEPLDVLIIETTRGDYETPAGFTRAGEEARFAQSVAAALASGGSVLIPLFALGKTQEVLAMIYNFRRKGVLGQMPIYIGGLSTKLTELHDRLAKTTVRQQPELQILDEVSPFTLAGREASGTPLKAGRIYALSSGMMTENTLSNRFARQVLSDPAQSLFFVGFADPESPAGRILATPPGGEAMLNPEHPRVPLRCAMDRFHFSGHSTRETIRAYVNRVRPKTVVLVHGAVSATEWFRQALSADLPGSRILVPPPGVAVEL